ncbi:ABC transporter permease [Paenibacillus sp. N1-5-1-14]|uniref:ABC transporter permease n=1 Tax=Paenibacillus radicibacter TaxID=2972488 RepID=UPI002158B9CE|nr:ABC transporter permease [Paenibacillus radicibacter]MCR8641933.1 ABC transporter permease [Paenibacillus radicibacter]
MWKYILNRLFYSIVTLWVIVTIVFVLMHFLPGDPFANSEKLSAATKEMLMRQYGLDKPIWEQYLVYMNNLLHGDLGASYQFPAQSVTKIIKQGFPASLELGIIALIGAVIVGLVFGTVAALKHQKGADYTLSLLAIIGIAVPSFVLAPLFSYYIGNKLGWLPAGLWKGPEHRVLPAIALSFGTIATLARLMRTSMLDVMQNDYIKTAKSKGLSYTTIVRSHMIRNAILPVITVMGPIFVNVITGTFVIEQIFSIPGLGKHFVTSIQSNDYTMITGITIFYAAILIAVLFITDIIYGLVDPRIRIAKGGK